MWEDTDGFGQDVITPLSLSTANSFSCYINVPVSYILPLIIYGWQEGRGFSLPADYKQTSDGAITTACFPGLALATFLPSSLCTQSVTEYISSTHCTAANPSNLIAMYKFLLAGQ